MVLLCQVFAEMRDRSGLPLLPLATPVVEYLSMMLQVMEDEGDSWFWAWNNCNVFINGFNYSIVVHVSAYVKPRCCIVRTRQADVRVA